MEASFCVGGVDETDGELSKSQLKTLEALGVKLTARHDSKIGTTYSSFRAS
jgi:hypothetical protein